MKYLNVNVEFEKPEKKIESVLKKCGAQDVRCSSSYSGARVDFKIDDKLDERAFKRTVCDELKRNGFRAY